METNKKQLKQIDETVLSTPKPRACSTTRRQQTKELSNINKVPLNFSFDKEMASPGESFGLLNFDNFNVSSYINLYPQIINKRTQQCNLTGDFLQGSKTFGLPSCYLKPSETIGTSISQSTLHSTVNESDLLQISGSALSGARDDFCTPRSYTSNEDIHSRSSLNKVSISSSIAELSHQIKNSNLSLADLCNKHCDTTMNLSQSIQENEDSFESEPKDYKQIMSITDFFQTKSNLNELFKNNSKKLSIPMSVANNSTLSVTELENAISPADNTNQIAAFIKNALTKNLDSQESVKENIIPANNSFKNFETPCITPDPPKDSRNVLLDTSNFVDTANSLEILPGGKLPIEINKIELVWGCVREGKQKTHSFTLRNKSQNKLQLQISSSKTNFRILNNQSELGSVAVLPIFMYPSESRCFTIVFTPSCIGAIVGQLTFTPVSDKLQIQQLKRQLIMMYGYGGYSKIEIQNVFKDTNMKMWLPLGKLDNKSQLHKKLILNNSGTITGFVSLKFISKAIYGNSKIIISPSELVIRPNTQSEVTVTYIPTKDDVKHLFTTVNTQIMEIGFIQVITGAEPLRGRMRRLHRKLKEESDSVEISLLEHLSERFPNEDMPGDILYFTESVGAVKELMQELDCKEITVILEKDSERTLVAQIGGIDETSMFQSLCEGMNSIMMNKTQIHSCTVEPSNLLLTSNKFEDCVLITSHCVKSLQFQCSLLPTTNVMKVSPCEGMLLPGQITLLRIYCYMQKIQTHQLFKLRIYVDDEVHEVSIKVIIL